ncbi:hypothetical protein HanIR_Chr06g0285751 [Helianthus annuus]|nr:hypothetical protein HanIR_Chr06g0285751 [Helianthus annuus]
MILTYVVKSELDARLGEARLNCLVESWAQTCDFFLKKKHSSAPLEPGADFWSNFITGVWFSSHKSYQAIFRSC